MNHNTQGVSRNGNQGGTGKARFEPIPSREGVGYPGPHSTNMGAGNAAPAGVCSQFVTSDSRCRHVGGQASIGLFGILSVRARRSQAKAPAPAVATDLRDRYEASMRLSERDELFDDSAVQMTPAMHAAARAADERERHGSVDDEEADFAHRSAGAGYVEAQMAIEG